MSGCLVGICHFLKNLLKMTRSTFWHAFSKCVRTNRTVLFICEKDSDNGNVLVKKRHRKYSVSDICVISCHKLSLISNWTHWKYKKRCQYYNEDRLFCHKRIWRWESDSDFVGVYGMHRKTSVTRAKVELGWGWWKGKAGKKGLCTGRVYAAV